MQHGEGGRKEGDEGWGFGRECEEEKRVRGEFVNERMRKREGRGWMERETEGRKRISDLNCSYFGKFTLFSLLECGKMPKSTRDEALYSKSDIMWTGGKNKKNLYSTTADTVSFPSPSRKTHRGKPKCHRVWCITMSQPQLDRLLIARRLLTADFMQNVKMGGLMRSAVAGGRCRFQPLASPSGHSADTGRSNESTREKSY